MLIAPFLAGYLIRNKKIDKPDAILVLAGSAAYKERTARAAELFREGAAPRIVLTDDGRSSGWSESERRNVKYVELAKRELVSGGVPDDRIAILDGDVAGTIDEAKVMCGAAERLGVAKVLLVTSGYHTRRALRAFEGIATKESRPIEFGIDGVAPGSDTPSVSTWWLSVKGWEFVAGEYVKAIYYETLL